jgi:hypothetical protein
MMSLAIALAAAFHGAAWAAPTNSSVLTAQQMREDLVYLRDVWAPMDRSFGPEQRAQFNAIVNAAIARAEAMSPVDFSLEISRAVAISGNGHTEAEPGPYFHGLPFKAGWFSDGLYIVRSHPSYSTLLGARIDRFGTLSAEEALKRVSPFVSGTPERIRVMSPAYLRLLEVLQRIGASNSAGRAKLVLTLRSGEHRSMVLGEEPSRDPEGLPPYQQLIRLEGDGDPPDRWPHLLDTLANVPTAYQQRTNLMTEWIPGRESTFYIKADLIGGQATSGTHDPLDDIISGKPRCVVIDLRFNSGGDFTKIIVFSQALPRVLPRSKIFVLVGPGTFSAALVMAAMLKGHGGERVVLVGETMGDRSQFWAEGLQKALPNSHILVRYASGYQDWSNGCDDVSRCLWLNVALAQKNVSLEPEIRVATKFSDYAAGHDSVLDAALAALDTSQPAPH